MDLVGLLKQIINECLRAVLMQMFLKSGFNTVLVLEVPMQTLRFQLPFALHEPRRSDWASITTLTQQISSSFEATNQSLQI